MKNNKRSVGIIGMGSYVPETIMTNYDLEKIVDTSDQWIVERTGIKERRIAGEGVTTCDLAVKAAQQAIENAGITPEEIDLIIVATVTPDTVFPAAACIVQDRIGAVNAAAFDLSAGCSGFVYGLTVGSQFISSGLYKKVLIIGAETLSKIMDWTDRNSCILFGDGAGAAVISEVEAGYGILGVELGADGSGGDHLQMPAGGSRLPASAETVKNRLHYIKMNGNEVFKFAVKAMGEAAVKALDRAGVDCAEIDCLIPHQANMRIIQSAAKRLKVPMEKVVVTVDKYGNTSAASIPMALADAAKTKRIKKGDTIVLVGFGAGLTWASCVMKWAKEEKN